MYVAAGLAMGVWSVARLHSSVGKLRVGDDWQQQRAAGSQAGKACSGFDALRETTYARAHADAGEQNRMEWNHSSTSYNRKTLCTTRLEATCDAQSFEVLKKNMVTC